MTMLFSEDELRRQATDPQTSADTLMVLARDKRVAALVAANHGAPAAVLEVLASTLNAEILRGLAGNPNTPPQRLVRLAPRYPEEFFANPGLPLFLLGDTNMLLRVGGLLVLHPQAPSALLSLLTRHPSPNVAAEARMHINLAGELGQDWYAEVADLLWSLPCWRRSRWQLACYYRTPLPLLARLVRDDDPRIRRLVATNPRLTTELLNLLANDRDLSVRQAVARHPNLSIVLIEQLANSTDIAIRRAIVRHPTTPDDLRARLWEAMYPERRLPSRQRSSLERGLSRLNTADGALMRGSPGKDAAGNPLPPATVLVSEVVAWLGETCTDEDLLRTTALIMRPAELRNGTIVAGSRWDRRMVLALNPHTDLAVLRALAQDTNRVVRAVARTELTARQGAV